MNKLVSLSVCLHYTEKIVSEINSKLTRCFCFRSPWAKNEQIVEKFGMEEHTIGPLLHAKFCHKCHKGVVYSGPQILRFL